jgi:hypothetical protein
MLEGRVPRIRRQAKSLPGLKPSFRAITAADLPLVSQFWTATSWKVAPYWRRTSTRVSFTGFMVSRPPIYCP